MPANARAVVLGILCRERDAWERFARSMRRRGFGPLDQPLLTAHEELQALPDWRAIAPANARGVNRFRGGV